MRTLAAELGVEAMSLYSYVPGKEDLLGLMAAHVINTVPTPSPRLAPHRRLYALAMSMRQAAQRFPRVFPLVVLKPLDLNASLRPTEIALQAYADAGFSQHRAIRCQRTFLSFVRGYLLWELGGFAAGRARGPGGRVRPSVLAEVEALDDGRYPQTKRHARTFFSISPEQAYIEGLACILSVQFPNATRLCRGKGCTS